MIPLIGFHSVMERPDSVSLVAPPTITIKKTRAARLQSQIATARATQVARRLGLLAKRQDGSAARSCGFPEVSDE